MSRRACQSPVQSFTSGLLDEPPIVATVLQYTMVLSLKLLSSSMSAHSCLPL